MRAEIHLCFVFLLSFHEAVHGNPVVNPGLFVMEGIATCGNSKGLCLLGYSCEEGSNLEEDYDGHCLGLERAFPNAEFVCCKHSETTTVDLELTKKSSHTYDDSEVKEKYVIRIHNLPSATDPSNLEATTEETIEITGISVTNNEDEALDMNLIPQNDKSTLHHE